MTWLVLPGSSITAKGCGIQDGVVAALSAGITMCQKVVFTALSGKDGNRDKRYDDRSRSGKEWLRQSKMR